MATAASHTRLHRARFAALAAAVAIAPACLSTDTLINGPSPCSPELRAVHRQVPAPGGRTPGLRRIPDSDQCGYYLHTRLPAPAAYRHYADLLAQTGWSVDPSRYVDPCAAHPVPEGEVCGGGMLLQASRDRLRFTLETEIGGAGRGRNICIVAASTAA